MRRSGIFWPLPIATSAIAFVIATNAADASVVISARKTSNMTCNSGVCAPDAEDAVLNVGDLEALLASGNVMITSTGTGVQAENVEIDAALTWATGSLLSVDAYESIVIRRQVSIVGQGGLSLTSKDGGAQGGLSFEPGGGRVSFANLSSNLTINGSAYTLVGDIRTLANDISSAPDGNYALADNYDASADGIYAHAPITTDFGGTLEGLGNSIENLSIKDNELEFVGLFAGIGEFDGAHGCVADLLLQRETIEAAKSTAVGGIVGYSYALLRGDFVGGNIRLAYAGYVGGLAVVNNGEVENSWEAANVFGWVYGSAGGLVGTGGKIRNSHATGNVSGRGSQYVGGLAGIDTSIFNSYSTGSIDGGIAGYATAVGGLVGYNDGTAPIEHSYSTGKITGNGGLGGLAGATDSRIVGSYSTAQIVGSDGAGGGGLVAAAGCAKGTLAVSDSFATGSVTVGDDGRAGGLIAQGGCDVRNSYATGNVTGGASSTVGGLIGEYVGSFLLGVSDTYATGTVTGGSQSEAGGLVGNVLDDGRVLIRQSFATGSVKGSDAGGLTGVNGGTIEDSYAIGSVSGIYAADGTNAVGGLTGLNGSTVYTNDGTITSSYSTGLVQGQEGVYVGGLIGYDIATAGDLRHTYWDTETSGVPNKSQGAGNIANDAGIKGHKTKQLRNRLPGGFSAKIWAVDPRINHGFPYLIDNPPPKGE